MGRGGYLAELHPVARVRGVNLPRHLEVLPGELDVRHILLADIRTGRGRVSEGALDRRAAGIGAEGGAWQSAAGRGRWHKRRGAPPPPPRPPRCRSPRRRPHPRPPPAGDKGAGAIALSSGDAGTGESTCVAFDSCATIDQSHGVGPSEAPARPLLRTSGSSVAIALPFPLSSAAGAADAAAAAGLESAAVAAASAAAPPSCAEVGRGDARCERSHGKAPVPRSRAEEKGTAEGECLSAECGHGTISGAPARRRCCPPAPWRRARRRTCSRPSRTPAPSRPFVARCRVCTHKTETLRGSREMRRTTACGAKHDRLRSYNMSRACARTSTALVRSTSLPLADETSRLASAN